MPPVLTCPEEATLLHTTPEAPPQPPVQPAPQKEVRGPRGTEWLSSALLERSSTKPAPLTWKIVLGTVLEILVLTVLVLLPLMYTDTIDLRQFAQTMLVAPPPPPPPPPAPAAIQPRAATVKRVFTSSGKLLAPTAIPERVAMLKEEALPPEVAIGVAGGVPGGVPGGQLGGVLGGIISDSARTPLPVAAAPVPRAPIRVGGRVKSPQQLYAPQPPYPALARQARIQGDVLLDAVIDPAGNVVELKVVSGHPLLLDAAIKAVSQWRYQPTLLNDEPISIQLIVTVQFRFH